MTEIETDGDYSSPAKDNARRRVDAYHEALRERHALHELEQPFVLERQMRRPLRY
jgi:hypothetical protein